VLQRITAGAACVSVRSPATLPPTALSVEALERITVNLVRNAAEAIRTQRLHGSPRTASPGAAWPAARPAGQIRVALAIVAGRLQLTVEDDGPGVPPAIAAAFLQPRPLPAHTSRGLGHRIVHELVTSTGGQLSLRVRPGKGTAFCIKWPIPHAAAERFDAANLPAPPTPPSLSLQGESSPC
jgi:nitrogen-specific signal transduction histidine kinase